MSDPCTAVSDLITQWQTARAELAELERREHPAITDRHGRVWTWAGGTLYRHCGIAAPDDMINQSGLPTQQALNNPNYDLCGICVDGRERKVPDCDPRWDCSHTMHRREA